ncbi:MULTISPECIES: DUF1493 family protein [unclassified Bradyrhizobium]|uniref:DUF1493 family protein n=1 Tax=unclassified Bradyrhizobium TaxID=2631580 RepID=UPI0024E07B30|nr:MULTISPECIES: DUF1493 family protein [unclassified Bradyrhizobium]
MSLALGSGPDGNEMTPLLSDPLHQRVLHFVAAQTGARVELSEQTDIARGLGLDGDDAHEFMRAFARAFDVDMSGFAFARHFGPEGLSLIGLVRTVLRVRRPRQPLTIATLVDAARQKRWPHDVTSKVCCAGFDKLVADAGQRGAGVVVSERPGGFVFHLQFRAVSPEDMRTLTEHPRPLGTAGNVTLAAAVQIQFCPYCGTRLSTLVKPSTVRTFRALARDHAAYDL